MLNKILIIDDNTIFCNAIKYHLLQKKYTVEIYDSYKEIQNKINIEEYDLILLEMKPKDTHFFDFIEYITEIKPETKIIIISSFLDDKNISKAKALGVFQCIDRNSNLFNELDRIIETL